MCMPRLSLYKPEKGNDYAFMDKQVYEMFTVGGTDIFVHKYLGPNNPDEKDATADQPRYDAVKETNIQDMLFLENRDRKYSEDIIELRGHYTVGDTDLDLLESVCVQHEIDHLNGITIHDREIKIEPTRVEKKIGRNQLVTIKKGDAVKVLKYKKAQNLLNQGWVME